VKRRVKPKLKLSLFVSWMSQCVRVERGLTAEWVYKQTKTNAKQWETHQWRNAQTYCKRINLFRQLNRKKQRMPTQIFNAEKCKGFNFLLKLSTLARW
jgi:hypothetical protein